MGILGNVQNQVSSRLDMGSNRKSVTADSALSNKFRNLLSSKAEMAAMSEEELGAADGKEKAAGVKGTNMDRLTINGYGDIQYKLTELQRIHEETDYSGMSDFEIYRTIRGRFERAFPNLGGKKIRSAIPKEIGAIGALWNQQYKDKIKDPGIYETGPMTWDEMVEHEKRYFGYEGLTNEEILQKHRESFKDDGSIDSRGEFLYDLWGLGVVSSDVVNSFGMSASRDCQMARRQYFRTNVDPGDIHDEWNVYVFGSRKMSWSEAKEMIFKEKDICEYFGQAVMEEIERLFDRFDEFDRFAEAERKRG